MPFVKKSTVQLETSAGTGALTNPDTIKGCQLTLGRANKAWDTKTTELTDARSRWCQAKQALGEKVADGEDASAEVHAMQAAESLVHQLDSAVLVAAQRKQAAEGALKDVVWHATQQECLRLVEQLAEEGRRHDRMMDDSGQHAREVLVPLMNSLRGLGFDVLNIQLNSANLAYKPKLLNKHGAMPGCRTAEAWFMKDEPWSALLPTADDVQRLKQQ